MLTVWKWLLLGDSLLVGFKSLPNAENRAVVGNTALGVLKTLQADLEACKDQPVILSLGSNMLFNNEHVTFNRINNVIVTIKNTGRKVIVVPIVAKGKYLERAISFNNYYRNHPDITFLDLDSRIHGLVAADNVHLTRKGYKIWLNQVEQLNY